jgi:hypothetical protein
VKFPLPEPWNRILHGAAEPRVWSRPTSPDRLTGNEAVYLRLTWHYFELTNTYYLHGISGTICCALLMIGSAQCSSFQTLQVLLSYWNLNTVQLSYILTRLLASIHDLRRAYSVSKSSQEARRFSLFTIQIFVHTYVTTRCITLDSTRDLVNE